MGTAVEAPFVWVRKVRTPSGTINEALAPIFSRRETIEG